MALFTLEFKLGLLIAFSNKRKNDATHSSSVNRRQISTDGVCLFIFNFQFKPKSKNRHSPKLSQNINIEDDKKRKTEMLNNWIKKNER